MAVDYQNLPFDEAIAFLRQKVNIPTARWNDLWQGQHARGFMVAGAAKAELLADFRASIDQAIELGTTLEEFRKDFDSMIARHGWSYNGKRGWRTQTIYSTNLSTAYAAGRYKQMSDPDVLAASPYWIYRHGDSRNPRPLHLAWDGTVLRADDPWWSTHYAPNGWGCSCYVEALSERDLAKLGKTGPDKAPDDGTYQWTDKATGEVHTIPRGIDPGWDYNVGEAAWGKQLSEQSMDAFKALKGGAWETLTPGDWRAYDRPERLPAVRVSAELVAPAQNMQDFERSIEAVIGGKEKIYEVGAGDWVLPVLVNAASLAGHVDLSRSPYISLLPDLMVEPQEVWLAFERHKGTGKVALKSRIIKTVEINGQTLLVVANSDRRGMLEGWTFIPSPNIKYINAQRRGRLIYGD